MRDELRRRRMMLAIGGAAVAAALVVVPVLRVGGGGERATHQRETRTDSTRVELAASRPIQDSVAPQESEADPLAWTTTAAPDGVQALDRTLNPALDKVLPARVVGQLLLNGEPWPLSGLVTWKGPTRSGAEPTANSGFDFEVEPGTLEFVAEFTRFPGVRSAPVRVLQAPNEKRSITLEVRVPELTISGRVVHADGSPAADVGLTCLIWLDEHKVTKTTRSGLNGEYDLRVPDLDSRWTVTCSTPGAEELERKAEAGESDVDFVVPTAGILRVRVRDGRTGEVLGREVGHQVLVRTGQPGFRRLEPLDEQPDPGGCTEFAVLDRSLDVLVLPRPELFPTYAPAWRMAVVPGGDVLDFVLVPGVTLEFERAATNEPWPAGHELYLLEEELRNCLGSDGPGDSPLEEFARSRRVIFDKSGRARIVNLAQGNVRFRVFPDTLYVAPDRLRLEPDPPPIEVHWAFVRTPEDRRFQPTR